ncbi:hypothetical protein [Fusobacterium sp. PH5-44]|uniref:hypothetical protein n=1 Tax=unclassified Fusobacterium TaxID=2648384 RepID=UPI003D20EED1
MKLFSYKRWFEILHEDEKNGKKRKFNRKIKIKRLYDSKMAYQVKRNEIQDETIIENLDFKKELIKYKTCNNIEDNFIKKFNIGNIFFKLKLNKSKNSFEKLENIILNVAIIAQSDKLSKNGKINRKEIEKKLSDENIAINTKEIKVKEIKISLETDIENFKKEDNKNKVLWKIQSKEEIEAKRKIYTECQNINIQLYNITKLLIKSDIFNKRYYLESFEKEIIEKSNFSLNSILESFKNLKKYVDKNFDLVKYINFLSNCDSNNKKISDNKKLFSNKISTYILDNIEITHNEIANFLTNELKYFNIIKRIEKAPVQIGNNIENTYIRLDKHVKIQEIVNSRNNVVKEFIKDIYDKKLIENITTCLIHFDIENLVEKLQSYADNLKNVDTDIYSIYKNHYQESMKNKKFDDFTLKEKELYKIIYRYLKGRIEKILVNRKKFDDLKQEIVKIFDFEILVKKVEKRIKQFSLEHLIYIGKLEHNRLDPNAISFMNEHANEELALELITFFSASNTELNKVIENGKKEEYVDFFGEEYKNNKFSIKKGIFPIKKELYQCFQFIYQNDELSSSFYSFLNEVYNLRNKILHGKTNKIFEVTKNLVSNYSDIEKAINNFDISDEVTSKNLNLDIIFKGKEKEIEEINKLAFLKNDQAKYLPNFSKLVPDIKKIIQENDANGNFKDEQVERIVINAALYVHKVLYLKEISNPNSDFITRLKCNLSHSDKKPILESVIELFYKNAQISASKGNKKAIKKFQNKIIETYLNYINEKYKKILNFSNFNLTVDYLKEEIKNNKNSKSKIILNTDNYIAFPQNDFEYIISILALLNDNIFVNKIRNRFFATDVWLKTSQYKNIIDILDKIISINLLREELKNSICDVGLVDINKMINTTIEQSHLNEEDERINIFNNKIKNIYENILNDSVILKNEKLKQIICKCFINKEFSMKNIKIKEGKIISKIDLSINKLPKEEREIVLKNKEDLNKIVDDYLLKEYNNRVSEIKKIISIIPTSLLKEYNKIFSCLSKDEKFKDIYFQEKKNENLTEKIFIYKKNIFNNVSNINFEKFYSLFLEEKLKNICTSILKNNEVRENSIRVVDKALKEINKSLNGYSKEYKKRISDEMRSNDNLFKRISKDKCAVKSYDEFLKIYGKVSDYKRVRDIVEFNVLNKINNYLIEINWKLAIQIARMERDLHYLVRGLKKLDIIKLDKKPNGELDLNNKISRAWTSDKEDGNFDSCHYKFKDIKEYQKFEDICLGFGIDLGANGDLGRKDSIRNYISHFHILREPFKNKSLIEIIDSVSDLLNYRTKYNNSTYNSIFEVFKKDVSLNYESLKRKFRLQNSEIMDFISLKKVSVLELDQYNGEENIETIKILLTKKI